MPAPSPSFSKVEQIRRGSTGTFDLTPHAFFLFRNLSRRVILAGKADWISDVLLGTCNHRTLSPRLRNQNAVFLYQMSLGDRMNVRRLAVVVNPRGGKRNGHRVLERVRLIFDAAKIDLEVHVTERAGHATEIAKNLDLRPFSGICSVGGDGTFHEVANGLMQRNESDSIPIGIIPAGTGNSVGRASIGMNAGQAGRFSSGGRSAPAALGNWACINSD